MSTDRMVEVQTGQDEKVDELFHGWQEAFSSSLDLITSGFANGSADSVTRETWSSEKAKAQENILLMAKAVINKAYNEGLKDCAETVE